MSHIWLNSTLLRSSVLRNSGWAAVVFGALLAAAAGPASADNLSVVRDLASCVGPIIGSALACQNIARRRIQLKEDDVSLEGFVSADVLIDGLRRCGPQIDTERLVDVLENTRNLDLGLGAPLDFGSSEHQASYKVWGTALDRTGKYQPIELE